MVCTTPSFPLFTPNFNFVNIISFTLYNITTHKLDNIMYMPDETMEVFQRIANALEVLAGIRSISEVETGKQKLYDFIVGNPEMFSTRTVNAFVRDKGFNNTYSSMITVNDVMNSDCKRLLQMKYYGKICHEEVLNKVRSHFRQITN